MRGRLTEHLLSILLVTLLLGGLLVYLSNRNDAQPSALQEKMRPLLELPFADYEDPFHTSLLRDMLDLYRPDHTAENDSLLNLLFKARQQRLVKELPNLI